MNTSTLASLESKISARDNRLLAALPADIYNRLLPDLKAVTMPRGKVIYKPGFELEHVYFPIPGCIVSMLYIMTDGASAEFALVGDEGMVGVSLLMGGGSLPTRAVVQSNCQVFQLSAHALKQEFERHNGFQHLLLNYIQALIRQISQTAVCNRHHTVEQQLCRWLLRSLDRLPNNEITMTHELIANMLGVRREGITEAARKLQARGLIRYSRGRITVLDRPGLEAAVCECYAVVRKEYDRLLPARSGWSSVSSSQQSAISSQKGAGASESLRHRASWKPEVRVISAGSV